jgi:hypothetical protein
MFVSYLQRYQELYMKNLNSLHFSTRRYNATLSHLWFSLLTTTISHVSSSCPISEIWAFVVEDWLIFTILQWCASFSKIWSRSCSTCWALPSYFWWRLACYLFQWSACAWFANCKITNLNVFCSCTIGLLVISSMFMDF